MTDFDEVLEQQVAICMAEYDRNVQAEADPGVRALLACAKARGKVERLLRQRTAAALSRAMVDVEDAPEELN